MCVQTNHEGHLMVFIAVQNLVGIAYSSFDNMNVFRLHEFGLKTPIYAPKIEVLGDLAP